MRTNFRDRLHGGENLIGTMITVPSPTVAEVLAAAGFDWLFIDGEHGPFGVRDLEVMLQAVGDRVACIVRVPANGEVAIKQALDLGAHGIIVPQVNTAAQAADVVKYSRYAPLGARGIGLARAHGYGRTFSEYLASANETVTVVVQAEHVDAVRNIDAIVEVPGIDAVLVGPYDLSASLGKPGRLDDAEVVAAIDRVTEACKRVGMPLGYFGVTAEAVAPFAARGYTLLVAGVDTVLLGRAAAGVNEALRGSIHS
jgi:2-keto-3-deoxy-L-rhamnonate aldolase RhmA